MNSKQLTNTLVNVACSLENMEQEIHKLTNRMRQLIDTQREPPASSVVTTDAITHTYQLGIIDCHLRKLQKFLIEKNQLLRAGLENEVVDAASSLSGFEIETQLHYILAKDDPQYDEEDDNILTSRSQLRSVTSQKLPLDNHRQQGWLSHDVMERDGSIGNPAIGPQGLLRVGQVCVEVITKRKYWLNLHTGQFENN